MTLEMTGRLAYLLLAGVLPSVLSGQCVSSTQGKEFVFGILDTIDSCCRGIVALDITNVSPVDTRIRLQIPYFSNDTYFTIPHGERKTIEIDPRIQKDGTFVDNRAIKISSGNDISVIVTNAYYSASTIETYNIMPVKALGNKYTISSFSSNDGNTRGSVLLAAGVYDKTHITLYNKTSIVYTVTVNSNEVFQYLCGFTCDLSGVKIISDKNLFVVSGSTYAYIPHNLGWDCIASAMIPTSAWSNRYIVPPVIPKRTFMIRLLSEHSFLNATIASSSKTFTADAGLTEHYFENQTVVVLADRPFSLTQYGVSNTYDYSKSGDAFMTVVPGIDQYLNDYIFTVPRGYYNVMYHAAVIVPEIYKEGLLFDGISRQSYKTPITVLKVPPPLDDFIVLTFQVDVGFHHFRQSFQAGNFGLFIYGLGYYRSYGLGNGFYAGFNLKGDCYTSTVRPVTTSKISTQTSPDVSSGQTSHSVHTFNTYSTTEMLKHINGSGQLCFVCLDLSHINFCDRVELCHQNEVCYVERYLESGHTKYKSGCMNALTCQTNEDKYSHSEDVCFECCHTNYCNNKGCGEDVPDRGSRGPICFDCEHVSSPEECFKVFPCNHDQVCRIEEYKWFGNSNFKMGCGQGACEPVVRIAKHVLKRATPVCQSCCSEDFCNRNCTDAVVGQGGSIIVG